MYYCVERTVKTMCNFCFRFITGFFQSGLVTVSFVLMSELVGPSKRGVVSANGGNAFSVGVALLSVTAWITRNWRLNSIVLAGGGLLMTPLFYWYVHIIFVRLPLSDQFRIFCQSKKSSDQWLHIWILLDIPWIPVKSCYVGFFPKIPPHA